MHVEVDNEEGGAFHMVKSMPYRYMGLCITWCSIKTTRKLECEALHSVPSMALYGAGNRSYS